MENGLNKLNNLLTELEGKTSKKAKKQLVNLETYLKDNNIELEKKEKEEEVKRIKPKVLFFKEGELDLNNRKRIIEDDCLLVFLNPTLIFIRLPYNHYYMDELKKIKGKCYILPFNYNPVNHGILISCEYCIHAFKSNNEFCKDMIKSIRFLGYGIEPFIFNRNWI